MNCKGARATIARELAALHGWSTEPFRTDRQTVMISPDGQKRVLLRARTARVEKGGRGNWEKDKQSAWNPGEWKALGIVQAAELLGKGVLP